MTSLGLQDESPSTELRDLVSLVRRFRPTSLMKHLAQHSSIRQASNPLDSQWNGISPWAISEIAKFASVFSNEWVRDRNFDVHALRKMCWVIHNLGLPKTDDDSNTLAKRGLLQMGFEQFPYQRDLYGSAARAVAVLVDTPNRHGHLAKQRDLANSAFGVDLMKAVYSSLLLFHANSQSQGKLSFQTFEREDLAGLFVQVSRKEFQTAAMNLIIPVSEFRNLVTHEKLPTPFSIRLQQNPLILHPIVDLNLGELVAPEPSNILRSVGFDAVLNRIWTQSNRYRQVGPVFQQYVEDLANQVSGAKVVSEFKYEAQGKHRDTIDFFLVLPGLLVMVEVKSARPVGDLISGQVEVDSAYDDVFGVATEQLNESFRYLREISSKQKEVPKAGNVIGLVVTAERFHLSNSTLFTKNLERDLPILHVCAEEFESLVQLDARQIVQKLLEISMDPEKSMWDLSESLPALRELQDRNPLIETALQHVTKMAFPISGELNLKTSL